jgi:glutamate-1-semialdehyde 2,1-aminomutase
MTAIETPGSALSARAAELAEIEDRALEERTPRSREMWQKALGLMPFGVASSFQRASPYPVYVERGQGSHVWDVDGNEYLDLHGGFGCNIAGHAHPKIREAIEKAAATGTHFGVTTAGTIRCAEVLAERFGVEKVRFTNSGTESTMDAIRVARAHTGRNTIVKIEGSYHGHHDQVMFSVLPNSDKMGGRDMPSSVPMSLGIPPEMADRLRVVPFNDAGAFERLLEAEGDDICGLILEPVMMNIGMVLPEPGYLQALRSLCDRHGVALIFDEVKTAATIHPGGAIGRFGVQPDLVCFAKAVFGGTPGGAFGGKAEWMDIIENGCAQMGTFNGNPLVTAACLAVLTEVMTPEAYAEIDRLGERMIAGCKATIAEFGVPAYTVDLGAKGCVSYRPKPITNYRDFLETRPELFGASFPYMLNRGIFPTPGDEEQWTLSVQTTDADVDHFLEVFHQFCEALTTE